MRRPTLRTVRRIIAETPEIGERLQRSQNVRLKRHTKRNTTRTLARNNLHNSQRNRNKRTHQRERIDPISPKISITDTVHIIIRPSIIITITPEISKRHQHYQNVHLKQHTKRNTTRTLARNNLHNSQRNRNKRTHQRERIDPISPKISITDTVPIIIRPSIIIPVIPSLYRTSKTTIVPDIQRAITWKNMVHMPKPAAQEAVMIESILRGHVLNIHSDMVQQETVLDEQVSKPPINQEDPG